VYGRPSLEDLPSGDGPSSTYARARRLTAAVAGRSSLTPDEIKDAHSCVHREDPASSSRTLWHGLYDAVDRSLEVSFYLGEGRRSPYLRFALG
jgi:hypothetical protein